MTVASGAELDINNGLGILAPTSLSLSGQGVSGNGALVGLGTNASLSTAASLANNSAIGTVNSSDIFTINGTIDGGKALTLSGPD